MQRRDCFRQLMGLVATSPLWAQEDDVMGPINIHEFEEALVIRAEREIMAQDLKAKQLAQELERAARHQRVVADDTLRLAQEQEDVQRSRVQAQDDAARAEQARRQAQDEMSVAQHALQQTRHDAENESQALSVLRAAAAAAAERHRAALQELRRREHEEQELATRLGRQTQELQESARQLQQLNLQYQRLGEFHQLPFTNG